MGDEAALVRGAKRCRPQALSRPAHERNRPSAGGSVSADIRLRLSRDKRARPPMRSRSATFLVLTTAAGSLLATGCGASPRNGHLDAAAGSSLTPRLYPTPLPTAQFSRELAAAEDRCRTLAAQRFPGSVSLGAGGTEAYGVVAEAAREHQTVTPPYLPSDATSWEPVSTCVVQTVSTDSAPPPSFPPGCSSIEMEPLEMQVYVFASGRSGTIAEKPSGGKGNPPGTCVLTYGTLPTASTPAQ